MREIEIRKQSDFEKLKKIPQNEDITLIVGENITKLEIKAINLSAFKGKIKVKFVSPKKQRYFKVTTNSQNNEWIFSNVQQGQVIYLNQHRAKTTYHYQPIILEIDNNMGFQKAISSPLAPKTILSLKHDMALCLPLPDYLENIMIDGNGHTIYGTKEIIKTILISSDKIKLENINFSIVDRVFEITHFEQIKKVREFKQEKIAVSLQRNIKNTYIHPINLSKFTGTLILLGNGHVFQNISLLPPSDSAIGLISSISEQANLICSDIVISKINFPKVEVEAVGCILGKTKIEKKPYKSPPGINSFKQCYIRNMGDLSGYHYTGIFVGRANEYAEFIDCATEYIFHPMDPDFVGDPFYFDEYSKKRNRILTEIE